MAHLNGNNVYLEINSRDVSARWMSGTWSQTVTDQNTSAGAGSTHEKHAAGLKAFSFNFTLEYNDTDIVAFITALQNAVVDMTVGPEGSGAGQPKDNRSILIQSVSVDGQAVEKTPVNVTLSGVGNDTPTTDFFAGGTF